VRKRVTRWPSTMAIPDVATLTELSPDTYRRLMRGWPSGVSVVATATRPDQPEGCTVSAFTSISGDPLLVLVSLASRTRTCEAVLQIGRFSVNVLGACGFSVAEKFAIPGAADRFDDLSYHSSTACQSWSIRCFT
jgi:flavin reductase (NADH)